jgi:hypothetical protein
MAPSLPVAAGASLVIPLNDLSPKQVAELESLRREYLQKVEAVLGFRVLGDAFEPPNMNAAVTQGFRPGPGPVPIPSPVMQQTPGIEQRTPMGQGMATPAPGAMAARTSYTPINHSKCFRRSLQLFLSDQLLSVCIRFDDSRRTRCPQTRTRY